MGRGGSKVENPPLEGSTRQVSRAGTTPRRILRKKRGGAKKRYTILLFFARSFFFKVILYFRHKSREIDQNREKSPQNGQNMRFSL